MYTAAYSSHQNWAGKETSVSASVRDCSTTEEEREFVIKQSAANKRLFYKHSALHSRGSQNVMDDTNNSLILKNASSFSNMADKHLSVGLVFFLLFCGSCSKGWHKTATFYLCKFL